MDGAAAGEATDGAAGDESEHIWTLMKQRKRIHIASQFCVLYILKLRYNAIC